MVDILVGGIPPAGPPVSPTRLSATGVEAELLNIRSPRKRITGPKGRERRKQFRQDPVGGKVLTILVANGNTLPKNLNTKDYRVVLRFVKK
ncbi:MAG TPA: hypothetical protein ENJ30_04895 [Desulfobulbaceae bacterium]|nr:hypothetical protein [Desulfobulbaceae bacterium]